MPTYSALTLLLPAAIILHVTEEFLFPGGFIEWYREFKPHKDQGDRPGYLVWINTLMIGVCIIPVYLGNNKQGISVWYCVAAMAAINACFHLWGVISLKKYSPGVVTGVLLYIPIFIYGLWYIVVSESLPWINILFFLGTAIGYHIFSVIRQRK